MCLTQHTRLDLPCFHFDPHGLQGSSRFPGVISRRLASEGLLWSALTSDSSMADITGNGTRKPVWNSWKRASLFAYRSRKKCGLEVRQSACHTFAPVRQMCRPICSDTPRGEQRHCVTPVMENTPAVPTETIITRCVCVRECAKGTLCI